MIRSRLLLALLVFALSATLAHGATRTWTGASSMLWSDAGNWQGGVAPVAGDALVFPRGAGDLIMTNDYPVDTTFHSLTLGINNQASPGYTIAISGNRLKLTDGIVMGNGFQNVHSLPEMDPVGSQTWTTDPGFGIAGAPTVTIAGTTIPAGVTLTVFGFRGEITLNGAGTFALNTNYRQILHFAGFTGTATTNASTLNSGLIVQDESGPSVTLRTNASPCPVSCEYGITIGNSEVGTIEATGGYVNVSPGMDPFQASTTGTLTMSAGARYVVAIGDSPTPPLTATGDVTLGGAGLLLLLPGEPIPSGEIIVLIDNQGSNPVSGTFAGLPEGARITTGDEQVFVISYAGGDGNDVTATAFSNAPSDFDGDGMSDILWRHSTTGENYLWMMDSFLPHAQGVVNQVPDDLWKIAGLGDFNGNSRCDVLWRHSMTGELYIYLMNGQSIVTAGSPGQVTDLNWQIAGVGDFNSDGKADILWRHELTGENYLYLMNGTQILQGGPLLEVEDPDWNVAGVADLNADGFADILWRHASTGEIYEWLMNGHMRIAFQSLGTISDLDWKITGVADLNGDGKADIVWRHDVTGENYLWLINFVIQTGYINTVPDLDWKMAGFGDYNADGNADILWRNIATGDDYLYLMDGFTITQAGVVPPVPDTGWVIQR